MDKLNKTALIWNRDRDGWRYEGSRVTGTRFTDIIPEMLRVVTNYIPGTKTITVNREVR
jgi:hypothetical protein